MAVPTSEHLVQFYLPQATLVTQVRDYIIEAFSHDATVILIATAAHQAAFASALTTVDIDIVEARASGRLVTLEAHDTLALFMTDEGPDRHRFLESVGRVVADAARQGRPVYAYGEMVGVLALEGQIVEAIELERMWSRLAEQHDFRLLCGYPVTAFAGPGWDASLASLCDAHDVVAGAEHLAKLGSLLAPANSVINHAQDVAPTQRAADRPLTACMDLPVGMRAPGVARLLVRHWLEAWDLTDEAWEYDVLLVVSELVGNAALHAGTHVVLTLRVDREELTVSVMDHSRQRHMHKVLTMCRRVVAGSPSLPA